MTVFGTPAPDGETGTPTQSEVDSLLADPEAAPEQAPPAGETAPPAPQEGPDTGTPDGTDPAPQSAETPADQQEQPTEDGTPETAQPSAEQLLAGRFRTQEDLVQGYQNVWAMHNRTAERLRQREMQLGQAIQYVQGLQSRAQQQPPAPAQGAEDEGLEDLTPEQVAKQITEATEQARAETRQEVEARLNAEADHRERQEAVSAFFQTSGVVPGSEQDTAVTGVLQQLEWGPYAEELRTAHEIVTTPGLREVIAAVPDLAQTDEGMALAKRMVNGGAPTPAPAAGATPEIQRRAAARAHVETGGGAPPAPSKTKDDVLAGMEEEAKRASSSIFGI